jgi:hypothetical protein
MSLRKRFEKWISSPPYERSILRFPNSPKVSWPGSYMDLDVDLAWQAWKACSEEMEPLRAVYREYKNGTSEGLARALRKAKPLVKKEK